MLRILSLAAALQACAAPLAPQDYRGEVIFRAQGVVESSSGTESWQRLKPVFAFVTKSQLRLDGAIEVRPVDESGISGEFQLELFDVPPDDVMGPFETKPDWGRVAMAVPVAVPDDHPERLERLAVDENIFGCEDARCACDDGELGRTVDFSYGRHRFHERWCCPGTGTADDETCRLVGEEGEAWVKGESKLPVDAVVPDVFMFYTERDAPAGSEMADYLFHSKEQGLRAGYHIVQLTPRTGPVEWYEEYDAHVVDTDTIKLKFQRDQLPWGVNL